MSESPEDKGLSEPQPLVVRPQSASTPRRGAAAFVVAVLALLLAGWSAWRQYANERGQQRDDALAQLSASVDVLTQGAEQRRRDLDSLRSRLGDADTVNKGVREEILALGERVRHVEDAIAHLAEQRLSGRDALALNEAEFLLVQAQERLALFHDADAAISAYRLADSALAAAEDPAFSSVRRTIAAERAALEAARPADRRATFDAIDRLRASLPSLAAMPTAPTAAAPSRWRAFVDSFVHISHVDADATAHEPAFARALVALDLRDAQAALLEGDAARYKAALGHARAGIAAAPDAQAAPVKAALAEVDRLAAIAFAPLPPELGSALKELRNLRATRALAQPVPVPATPAPSTDAEGAGT